VLGARDSPAVQGTHPRRLDAAAPIPPGANNGGCE